MVQSGLIVDCQTHWHPRSYFDVLTGRQTHPRARASAAGTYVVEYGEGFEFPIMPLLLDLDRQVEEATMAGVDVLVTSTGAIGVEEYPAAEGRYLAELINEETAAAQRRHPGRVVGLARVPLQDPDAAVEMAEQAVSKHGLRGICIAANIGGESIAGPELAGFYATVERLDVPLFIHPTRTRMGQRFAHYGLEYVLGFMADSSIAALELIMSGTLEAHPKLKVVHPHLGGVLPFLVGRIDFEYRQPWALGESLSAPPSEYLARFYTDTISRTPGSLHMARELYGVEHLLFASDYPYWPLEEELAFTRAHLSDGEQMQMVLGANAQALLGLTSADPERATADAKAP